MPRPPLAPGAHLYMATDNPDEWTWAEARPLLAPGARVRLIGWDDPVFELQADGTWLDMARQAVSVEDRAAVLVRLAAEAEGELVALPRPPARPALPAALDVPDDPVEVRVRDALVDAGARSLGLLVDDLRANPGRALRRLRVAERVAHVLREGIAELGLDDEEDGGVGEDFQAMGLGDGRRRRRRPGFAGGHAYGGQMDQQTALNGAVRAQHMQALTQTIERTAPNGPAPHPGVYDAAVRELALLFPAADAPRPPDEPAGAPDATIRGTEDAP